MMRINRLFHTAAPFVVVVIIMLSSFTSMRLSAAGSTSRNSMFAAAAAFTPSTLTSSTRISSKSRHQHNSRQQQPQAQRRHTFVTSSTTAAASAATTDTKTTTDDKKKKSDTTVVKQVEFTLTMDDVVSLCKRRGMIFPSSEIYNGYAGFYDYGPLGSELKKNVKDAWWKTFVYGRDDVVGVDSSIVHHPQTWQSSGHVDGFSDPMVDCKETKLRYRADQLFYSPVVVDDATIGYVCIQEGNDADMVKDAKKQVKALLKELERPPQDSQRVAAFQFRELMEASAEEMEQIPSPGSGKPTLTMPRDFNLMFQTFVGATTDTNDASAVAYLRPETAQGIFLNYKNCLDTAQRQCKIPFGIAQIGKAFRNEITPRNFIFRSREFEQMEIEYFIPPDRDDHGDAADAADDDEKDWQQYHAEWIADSKEFLLDIGLTPELIEEEIHADDKLAHYARACTDLTFQFPFGQQELMGIAARGNYDLTQHSEGSGKNLDYFDDATKQKYVPHCIEPSLGVDRLILALICSAYCEDEVGGEKRSLLKFSPKIAPIKCVVMPLLKNKQVLVDVATELHNKIKTHYNCQYDAAGAIGRRYRRADEVGVPYCITVDFDTIEQPGQQVTIRDRDTTEQIRMPVDEVLSYLSQEIDGF